MNDADFLRWVRDRLVQVNEDSENADFIIRLNKIIKKVESAPSLGDGFCKHWNDCAHSKNALGRCQAAFRTLSRELGDEV